MLNKDGDKKVILCFGSSTTWGYDPAAGGIRFPEDVRWPTVMAFELGSDFAVIEEGFSGRSVLDHIPYNHPANGYQYLDKLLETMEFDFIIIWLGINDLFANRETSVKHIAEGIEKMIHKIKFSKPKAHIIIVAPPQINEDFDEAYLCQSEIEKSKKFSSEYKHIASANSCFFLDAGKIVSNSNIDGIHLEKEQSIKFGRHIAGFIKMSI